ncbi:MAG TPA: hypothetical protein DCP71_01520 [Verrucomicrobiales bacterium]|nr:hypothetical protein [Verrucomicrobiales bacterium]
MQQPQHLDQTMLNALHSWDGDVGAFTSLDEAQAELFKTCGIFVPSANAGRNVIRVHDLDNVIPLSGSDFTKLLGSTTAPVCAGKPEQQLMAFGWFLGIMTDDDVSVHMQVMGEVEGLDFWIGVAGQYGDASECRSCLGRFSLGDALGLPLQCG